MTHRFMETLPENRKQEAGEGSVHRGRPRTHSLKRRWPWLGLIILVMAALGGGYWWVFMHGRVTTEDAYIHADVASISSRIPGSVLHVHVDNDQRVEEGDVLVDLDPKDYQISVDLAEAGLARIDADIKAAEANISLVDSQTQAQIQSAQEDLEKAGDQEQSKYQQMRELEKNRLAARAELTEAEKNYERTKRLYTSKSISKQALDEAETVRKKDEANLKALDAAVRATDASLKASRKGIDQARTRLELAQKDRIKLEVERHRLASLKAQRDEMRGQLDQAKLQLSYCTIKAPISGVVAQKDIQVGDRINIGQPFMAVVPLGDAYVEANFKETQLTHVEIGQPAIIKADTYPDYTFRGRVESIGAGTGAAFSLLPPENATGNWIKVVRRVPVRIRLQRPLPSQYPLRIGLSLEVTIDTRKNDREPIKR
jgi:membrane fusion protein (multidrug efflux system)